MTTKENNKNKLTNKRHQTRASLIQQLQIAEDILDTPESSASTGKRLSWQHRRAEDKVCFIKFPSFVVGDNKYTIDQMPKSNNAKLYNDKYFKYILTYLQNIRYLIRLPLLSFITPLSVVRIYYYYFLADFYVNLNSLR